MCKRTLIQLGPFKEKVSRSCIARSGIHLCGDPTPPHPPPHPPEMAVALGRNVKIKDGFRFRHKRSSNTRSKQACGMLQRSDACVYVYAYENIRFHLLNVLYHALLKRAVFAGLVQVSPYTEVTENNCYVVSHSRVCGRLQFFTQCCNTIFRQWLILKT